MSPRALLLVPVVLTVVAVLPAPGATAVEKAPGVGLDASGVLLHAPGGQVAYLARSGRRNTRLIETAPDGGSALRSLRIHGRFAVPAVAYDGLPAGLSSDGRTLILIRPRTRFPRANTTLAVVDARLMRLRRQIHLRGDFSFDAISPNGRLAYLIQYLSPRDQTAYAVRAYDMRARRLFPEPVVDPSEPDEDMSGVPLSRVSDAEGRWAYTLYSGHKYPFVHALDTERRTAVCIDLDDVRSIGVLNLRGDRLDVLSARGSVIATIDTATHRVTSRRKPTHASAAASSSAGTPWLLIAGPTAALLLLAAAMGRRRLSATA